MISIPRSTPSRRFINRFLPGLVLMLFALSCYDSDPIQTAALSPDGRFIAWLTEHHELCVLDLARSDPVHHYSHQAGDGLVWSPNSQKLVYIDQPEGAPSSLMAIDIVLGRAEPLVRSPAWKANPVWMADGRVAYLSDTDAGTTGVWAVDPASRAAQRLIQRPGDISRLWASPAGDVLVFRSVEGGADELWTWRRGAEGAVQLTQAKPGTNATPSALAFSRDGKRFAYCDLYPDHAQLVWFDLAARGELDRFALPRPPTGLAVTNDGRVAAGQGESVLLWRPNAGWYQSRTSTAAWNSMPLDVLGAGDQAGLALALNHNIIMIAEKPARLDGAQLRPARVEDRLALAYAVSQKGGQDQARNLIEPIGGRGGNDPHQDYLADMAQAQLERAAGHWREVDKSLSRATRDATPGENEEEAAWLERLAIAAFNAQDRPLVNWIQEKMPPGLDSSVLAVWTRQLMETSDTRLFRTWLSIGGALRGGNFQAVAKLTDSLISSDNRPTTLTLQGISLLLGGDFEPLGNVDDLGQKRLEGLMAQPLFQKTLLVLMKRNLHGGPTPTELHSLLLGQWVRQGDFSSARELVRDSFRFAGETVPEYLEMMRRFLVIEESDRWLQRAVTDVLLDKEIAGKIYERLQTPEDRLTLRLAQLKKGLIDGDLETARSWTDDVLSLEAHVVAADPNPTAAFERAQGTFLTLLFLAKLAEHAGQWTDAANRYEACAALMQNVPGSWEVSPYEVATMSELIRIGSARDPGLLRDYLRVLYGSGDPLINPSHNAATIQAGLMNLTALTKVAADPWLKPYLSYTQGLYYSLTGQSWRALAYLETARRQNPPPALRARILLEEGAVRDALGQHELAARLYGKLCGTETPPPQRAAALQAAIQAQAACGAIKSPQERLKELVKDETLPKKWRDWLWLQQGLDPQ